MSGDARPFDCFYRLDAEDRFLDWGGPQWANFTRNNGGAALASVNLRGRSVFESVAGHFTKQFLKAFLAEARATRTPQTRTYRCDSAAAKRLMEMRALREDDGALRVEHRLLEEATLSPEIAFQQAPGRRRPPFQRCSICSRLKRAGLEAWREPEAFAETAEMLRVVHTVCPDCRKGVTIRAPPRPEAHP